MLLRAARRLPIATARRGLATQRFPVPAMGDSITEGTLLEWVKQPGDAIGEEETIAFIETDKVTVEVKSPAAGTVTAVLAEIESNVIVGADVRAAGVSLPRHHHLRAALFPHMSIREPFLSLIHI